MHSALLKFTVALNSALLSWIPLVFEFRHGMTGTFLCSMPIRRPSLVMDLSASSLPIHFLGPVIDKCKSVN
jgi:hypothetical protein